MRLAVDASTLIAEVLRARGRRMLGHPDLELVVAEDAWEETRHELQKRVATIAQRNLLDPDAASQLLEYALVVLVSGVTILPASAYADHLPIAQSRIPRDPNDAATVALALVLNCDIWTNDYDFFGCGLPVWSTEALLREIDDTFAQ